jgi:hypothetical protein
MPRSRKEEPEARKKGRKERRKKEREAKAQVFPGIFFQLLGVGQEIDY